LHSPQCFEFSWTAAWHIVQNFEVKDSLEEYSINARSIGSIAVHLKPINTTKIEFTVKVIKQTIFPVSDKAGIWHV
jgi:hypothetical protein